MKKIKLHEFDPVVYPLKLWVVNNANDKFINDNFETIDGLFLNFTQSETAAAQTYNKVISRIETQKYGILVLIKSKININHTAHEATHVARIIWDWFGEECTGREADAYLVGWISDCIYKSQY